MLSTIRHWVKANANNHEILFDAWKDGCYKKRENQLWRKSKRGSLCAELCGDSSKNEPRVAAGSCNSTPSRRPKLHTEDVHSKGFRNSQKQGTPQTPPVHQRISQAGCTHAVRCHQPRKGVTFRYGGYVSVP